MGVTRLPVRLLAACAAICIAAILPDGVSMSGTAHAQGIMHAPAPAAPEALPEPDISTPPVQSGQSHDPVHQFDNTERWMIPYYFKRLREQQRRAGRSKVYQRSLPAGLEAPPAIGDILGEEALQDMLPLPAPLVRELPAPRPDTRRYIAGQAVILVQISSSRVLDMLPRVIY